MWSKCHSSSQYSFTHRHAGAGGSAGGRRPLHRHQSHRFPLVRPELRSPQPQEPLDEHVMAASSLLGDEGWGCDLSAGGREESGEGQCNEVIGYGKDVLMWHH
uniref:Uncharacterized protein n=1 Tax=Knipowitschia caucasica TaxID=637954 RepID=A0AAV2IZR3_KNICA